MEYFIFIIFAVAVLLFILAKGYIDFKREEKTFINRLYQNYGKEKIKEYKPERLVNIPGYYEKHPEDFQIDDITFNDLNLLNLFMEMNSTYSAAGEEYLYHLLRTPDFSKEQLQRKEEIIRFFMTHHDERVKCQFLFHKLGNTGKFSIYDYLEFLDDLGERKNLRHYLALLAVAVSVVVMFVDLPIGLALLISAFVWNIMSYFKFKAEVDPYITSFSYINRMLSVATKMLDIKLPILKNEWEELKECVREMGKYKRGDFLLMSPTRMAASGNPLDILLDYLRMVFHLDLLQFNKMLRAVREQKDSIDRMISILGEMEALIVVGAYRTKKAAYCVPEFKELHELKAVELYHPLLEQPVKNDITVNRSVLITGSNASGKSTFLKTLALNQILAQTIHTVFADAYQTFFTRVCSSMALRDDLEGGDSYYMVEIKALKRIMAMVATDGAPVLCFVDEVLRGTNTVERIAASTQILRSLNDGNCLCFAATHDIELTHLLEKEFENYHFKEEIEGNDISFSYKLLAGRAGSRNAIKLLGIMGYDEKMIADAEMLANTFIKTGKWGIGLDE
ncbi:MAG: hypothetical protein IKY23_10955 [Lachnospiraceae bacterium]|nr:hypothetical protein [Lachnospiraceae bacterium]